MSHQYNQPRRGRGFERTSGLLQHQIRKVGESRGFAVTRLLTHWAEIVGQDIAEIALPVKVGHARGALGASLTLLTTGPRAPELQAMLPMIRDRVNAVYGYSAISRIRITQTAPTGFSEGKVAFAPARPPQGPAPVDAQAGQAARESTRSIDSDPLRHALEELGKNVLSRSRKTTRTSS